MIHPHKCSWASPTPLRTWIEQKGGGRVNLIFLLELGHSSSPALGHHHPGSWAFRLRLGVTPLAPFSGLRNQNELYHQPSWFSGSQTADCRTSQPSQPCEASPIIHIYVSTLLVLFLWRPPSTWVFWYPLKVCIEGDCLTSLTLYLALPLVCTELPGCSWYSLALVLQGETGDSGLPALHSPALHWWVKPYISPS